MNQGTFPFFYENNSFEKHKYRKRGGGMLRQKVKEEKDIVDWGATGERKSRQRRTVDRQTGGYDGPVGMSIP